MALPATAAAQAPEPVFIDGAPLKIWAAQNMNIQVNVDETRSFTGQLAGEFYHPNLPSPTAGFGIFLSPGEHFGVWGRNFPAPTEGPTAVPTGDPNVHLVGGTWDLETTSAQLRLTEAIAYVQGDRQFITTYEVENVGTSTPTNFRVYVGGDLAIRGSDQGVGLFEPSTPFGGRFVGGLNQDVGGTGGFAELSPPWSNYQSGPLGEVSFAANNAGFQDTVSPDFVDNAAGVEWDVASLAPNESQTFTVAWRFVSTVAVTPSTATKQTGESHKLTATVADPTGAAAGRGTDVVWQVNGVNNTSPVTTNTGGTGKTTFTYVGGAPGNDEVTAFVDQNTNGTRDTNEPQVTSSVTWEGPQPPQQGETANAGPVGDGTVRVKFPSGASGKSAQLAAKRLGVPLSAAQSGFVQLTENTPIPIGSSLDTSKGTVQLLTEGKATKKTGGSPFSTAKFNGGTFKVNQKGKAGIAEMQMQGGQLNACPTGFPKGGAPKQVSAARKSRRLLGRGRGRFRTRGRNSSATVRGTKWLVKDTCKGTTTSVSQGKVVVRDFVRKRTITLKKGQKYLAKAPKAKKNKKNRRGRRGGLTR
jgi:hypothetical protein